MSRASSVRLIAITDVEQFGTALTMERFGRLLSLTRPRSVCVQLRDRESSARERLELGQRLRAVCQQHEQMLSVNDRLDIAKLLEAQGVHLPEGGVTPQRVRDYFTPATVWISRAWHLRVGSSSAPPADVDALVVSPIMAPRKGRPALGMEGLRVADELAPKRSLFALGGIDSSNARRCLEAGASGVAAIGAIYDILEQERLVDALGIRR